MKVLMGVKRRLGPPSSARQWRFLDAGCGIGDKVFLASDMGFEAHGVELDESLIRAAKRRFEARQVSADSYTPPRGDRLTLYRSDITRFTYSSFDVVFFYCPFSDPVAEGRFERRVWDQVAPGGFVIACAPETKPPRTFRSIEMPEATAGFTGWKIYQRR
ncbi:MAG: class I SAM-dependent methyltransferase [Planctomycetota bacterium]